MIHPKENVAKRQSPISMEFRFENVRFEKIFDIDNWRAENYH